MVLLSTHYVVRAGVRRPPVFSVRQIDIILAKAAQYTSAMLAAVRDGNHLRLEMEQEARWPGVAMGGCENTIESRRHKRWRGANSSCNSAARQTPSPVTANWKMQAADTFARANVSADLEANV